MVLLQLRFVIQKPGRCERHMRIILLPKVKQKQQQKLSKTHLINFNQNGSNNRLGRKNKLKPSLYRISYLCIGYSKNQYDNARQRDSHCHICLTIILGIFISVSSASQSIGKVRIGFQKKVRRNLLSCIRSSVMQSRLNLYWCAVYDTSTCLRAGNGRQSSRQ